ncbi:MAG: 2-amino-4-hydroxy-6-hydroxymethyldihydropteridine diphosphokinase [Candidatus Dormibacteraceae bacterium]
MTRAFVALGANLGERERSLERARASLRRRGALVLRESSVSETDPFGVPDQPRFLNQVVEVEWPDSPGALLEVARAVEAEVGRRPSYRWGPREIDVDIVLFGDQVVEAPGLRIPHPGLRERRFVLEPLLELEPDLRHPATGEGLRSVLDGILER